MKSMEKNGSIIVSKRELLNPNAASGKGTDGLNVYS